MQCIILNLRSSTNNILILFLPEIYAVLITKLNVHFYGPINNTGYKLVRLISLPSETTCIIWLPSETVH